jgi:hypothetical protein
MMELNLKSTVEDTGIQRNVKGVVEDPASLIAVLTEFVRITLSNNNLGIKLFMIKKETPEEGGEDEFSFDRN